MGLKRKLPQFLAEDTDGFIHVEGHRIGLQHLMRYYNEGYSAEMLLSEYPTLSPAMLHKVIAFYLENRTDVDEYFDRCTAEMEESRRTVAPGPSVAELRCRLDKIHHASEPDEWRDRIQFIPE